MPCLALLPAADEQGGSVLWQGLQGPPHGVCGALCGPLAANALQGCMQSACKYYHSPGWMLPAVTCPAHAALQAVGQTRPACDGLMMTAAGFLASAQSDNNPPCSAPQRRAGAGVLQQEGGRVYDRVLRDDRDLGSRQRAEERMPACGGWTTACSAVQQHVHAFTRGSFPLLGSSLEACSIDCRGLWQLAAAS